VGNKIKRMKPGDKVIPVWQAECQTCPKCRSGRTNICDTFVYNWNSGLMPADKKTTRFSRVSDGAPIYHFFGTSCFSQGLGWWTKPVSLRSTLQLISRKSAYLVAVSPQVQCLHRCLNLVNFPCAQQCETFQCLHRRLDVVKIPFLCITM
jgi:hypothetical protein